MAAFARSPASISGSARSCEDFPRGLIIEASDDGQSWREVWKGGSAGLAFAGGVRGAARRAAAIPVRADAGAAASDEADGERRDVLLVDRGDARAGAVIRWRTPRSNHDKRSTSPLGIIIALGALGMLLVLLFFQSSPSTDLPPDQGPMAMALVDNMMTNGVLVDYDARRTPHGSIARCGRSTTSSSAATC